ncbi:MAG: glycoside hydrolase family 1 protein [Patescibacteria group bacterium]|nr:glycoside hydrolase family 1 protein [Patescibacteria group bacterium]
MEKEKLAKKKKKKTMSLSFPNDFFWGSSTSSYQVEGGNVNDWSQWEKKNAKKLAHSAKSYWKPWQIKKFPQILSPDNYICDKACDHYHRYEEDFDWIKSLHQNAHRLSIEWSRIEPAEGRFDKKELQHYRKVLEALRARGIEPFVTLKHYTNPIWLSEKGGIASPAYPRLFSRYVQKVVQELGDLCQYWITVNEPMVIIHNAHLTNNSWPGEKSLIKAHKYFTATVKAHNMAYDCIKQKFPQAQIGVAKLLNSWEPVNKKSFLDMLTVRLARYFSNEKFINAIKSKLDFIGVNYYFHDQLKFPYQRVTTKTKVSDLNWEIYPKGIYKVLQEIKKYNLPIYITENGLADASDKYRADFIKEHLFWINKAIQEKIPVKGYFHWSLMDNFEWNKGFWPRFGLLEIDYHTLTRKLRPSGKIYAEICATNKLKFDK